MANNDNSDKHIDNSMWDELDFGDDDEDLLSALQVTKKREHSLDVSEYFEDFADLADEADGEVEHEDTTVFTPPEAGEISVPEDAPETTVLASDGGAPETIVFASDDAPETTVLGAAEAEHESEPEEAEVEAGPEDAPEAETEPEDAPETTVLASGDALETTVLGVESEPEAPASDEAEEEPEAEEAPAPEPEPEPVDTAVEAQAAASGPAQAESLPKAPPVPAVKPKEAAQKPPAKQPEPKAAPKAEDAKERPSAQPSSRKGLIIGLCAAAVVAVVAIVFLVVTLGGGSSSSDSEGATTNAGSSAESSTTSSESKEEKTFTVSIEYRETQTNKALKSAEEKVLASDEMPKSIAAQEISGYEIVSATDNGFSFYGADDRAKGKAAVLDLSKKDPTNHKIVFQYAKQVNYTVRYLESGTNAEIWAAKVQGGSLAGDVVTEAAIDIEGYNLVSENPVAITLTADDASNVITFVYEKKPVAAPQTNNQSYNNNYNYSQPTYTPPATPAAPSAPAAPADDAVDGSW